MLWQRGDVRGVPGFTAKWVQTRIKWIFKVTSCPRRHIFIIIIRIHLANADVYSELPTCPREGDYWMHLKEVIWYKIVMNK